MRPLRAGGLWSSLPHYQGASAWQAPSPIIRALVSDKHPPPIIRAMVPDKHPPPIIRALVSDKHPPPLSERWYLTSTLPHYQGAGAWQAPSPHYQGAVAVIRQTDYFSTQPICRYAFSRLVEQNSCRVVFCFADYSSVKISVIILSLRLYYLRYYNLVPILLLYCI